VIRWLLLDYVRIVYTNLIFPTSPIRAFRPQTPSNRSNNELTFTFTRKEFFLTKFL
jgi:hypothetical protein